MPTRKTSPPEDKPKLKALKPQSDNVNGEKRKGVSPRSGAPTPIGRPFTRKTAQEAAKKSNETQARRKSIKQSFLAMMEEEMIVERDGKKVKCTGAEAIAHSIISGSIRNNAKMTELALALLDEKPKDKIDITMAIPKFDNLDEAFRKMHGGDAS